MARVESAHWLADVARPLGSKFGADLSIVRDGDAVRWAYEGASALIQLQPDGALDALFVESLRDGISAAPAACVYRGSSARYPLDREGSARMVADMVDFFSGVREPRFTFVDVYSTAAP